MKILRPASENTHVTVLQELQCFGYVVQTKNAMGWRFVLVHLKIKKSRAGFRNGGIIHHYMRSLENLQTQRQNKAKEIYLYKIIAIFSDQ